MGPSTHLPPEESAGDAVRLPGLRPALEIRDRAIGAVRGFFHARGFLEVETPVRIPAPALELHIDAESSGRQFLRTSPELHMKRLIASGYERIFQIGPCFRRGERGQFHQPEYTMLEWYRAGGDYRDILADTRALLPAVAQAAIGRTVVERGGTRTDLSGEWRVLTVREVFAAFAGWDPVAQYDGDRFDLDLVEKVEPNLPRDRPVVLTDYPVPAAALARCRADQPPVAERWELYVGGIELANAFSELTDAAEQRRRFEACAEERRRLGKDVYALDEDFLEALDRGMPSCGGAAMGIDRLVMLLAGSESVQDVMAFC